MTDAEGAAMVGVLDDLGAAVEDLVRTGLTTASKATLDRLEVSFREASRLKLGRLAASLRFVNEEIGRHLHQSPEFSAARLSLFLDRSWVLARGLAHAIRQRDTASIDRLTWSSAPTPVAELVTVTLGVRKRVTQTTGSFDFYLRSVADGAPYVWSFVYPRKDLTVPAEAWFHLPQKPTGMYPKLLAEPGTVVFRDLAVAGDRIVLGPPSKVEKGPPFTDWARFGRWDVRATARRLRDHRPGPLDLEIELDDEIVLADWTLGTPVDRGRPGTLSLPLTAVTPGGAIELDAIASTNEGGKELRSALDALRSAPSRPPLFGVVHVDLCRLVFQPLSALEPRGPRHLMLSTEKIDTKQLLKTMTF
ncbi:MAG: hypothetical protein ABMB14_06115 [Myxococcota bacterium]